MSDAEGLDKWISKKASDGNRFSKSLFPHEQIALHSLKERITELEAMRDKILYELDRLKMLAEDRICE